MTVETNGPQETFQLGERLGKEAAPGSVFCLYGDLGVGKTVFSQGFAHGLGIEGPVNSPTFTILQQYEDGRLPLYHFDLYRIADISELDEIGYEEYFYSDGLCLVEWGNLFREIFPEHTIRISISKELEKGFDYRKIIIEGNVDL